MAGGKRRKVGKFILGIGAGEGMNLKAYNIPYDHALTKMTELIKLMKSFWKKGLKFEGQSRSPTRS